MATHFPDSTELPTDSDASASGVAWGAILAGATAAAALSLVLLVLGVGLGISAISPWTNLDTNSAALRASTIGWLASTQLAASGVGGYLAGRLRIKWSAVHSVPTREVHFVRALFWVLVVGMLTSAPMLNAALPAPTPEQLQAAHARKAQEAEEAKHQADALSRVQDSIAARFGKGLSVGARTDPQTVSQKSVEAAGTAGPHGGTTPSAEAHSGEAGRN